MSGMLRVIDRSGLTALLDALRAAKYRLIGPTVRDGAIVYDELHSAADLPIGWTDEQAPGHYRIRRRADDARFGYVVGPTAWKRWLFPPREKLITLRLPRDNHDLAPQPEVHAPHSEKTAFIGVRACELRAIQVQDRVFLEGPFVDTRYRTRREQVLIVAVNCGQAAATCFCTSMGTGPRVGPGFDIALTERIEHERHDFIAEAGTPAGEAYLNAIPGRTADETDAASIEQIVERASAQITRRADQTGIRDLLFRNLHSRRWDAIAERCLACANCTLVCPTCFCSNVRDVTDLRGESAERWREWDSCFNDEFSYIVGGPVRGSIQSRYRQWMTHKLAGWHDQFGESGCVGCGRCITWCPVGIDITQELAGFRADASLNSHRNPPGPPEDVK